MLATSRPPAPPAVLDEAEQVVTALVEHGFDDNAAFSGYLALSGYVQGMALLLSTERNEQATTGVSYRAWSQERSARWKRTGTVRRHGWAVGPAPRTDTGLDDSIQRWFEDGLRHLLNGLLCRAADAPDHGTPAARP